MALCRNNPYYIVSTNSRELLLVYTPELVTFLRTCVIHGIEPLAQEQNHHLSEKLSQFKDVLI